MKAIEIMGFLGDIETALDVAWLVFAGVFANTSLKTRLRRYVGARRAHARKILRLILIADGKL